MTHKIPNVTKHEPDAIINDSQRPTWDIVIEKYLLTKNDIREEIKLEVITMMKERDGMGFKKHGTHLTPNNGRDSLIDAMQEVLDAVVYLQNALLEEEDTILKKFLDDSIEFSFLLIDNLAVIWSIRE